MKQIAVSDTEINFSNIEYIGEKNRTFILNTDPIIYSLFIVQKSYVY